MVSKRLGSSFKSLTSESLFSLFDKIGRKSSFCIGLFGNPIPTASIFTPFFFKTKKMLKSIRRVLLLYSLSTSPISFLHYVQLLVDDILSVGSWEQEKQFLRERIMSPHQDE